MDMAKPGLIQKFCVPNGILTFKEYLLDYASEKTRKNGEALINKELEEIGESDPERRKMIEEKIALLEKGERDIYV